MVETKISTYKQMDIYYSSDTQKFIAFEVNEEHGTRSSVMDSESQKLLEKKIDRLLKRSKKFPIKVFKISSNDIVKGKLTSFVESGNSRYGSNEVWISYDEPTSYGRSRTKDFFGSKTFFRQTEHNQKIFVEAHKLQAEIDGLDKKLKNLLLTAEDPITLEDLM